MKKRKIIKIIDEKCVGCGICTNSCAEGAIQIIDGKARLVNEIFCDGLGACIKECPYGAIVIEEREAKPYNEIEALKNIIKYGKNAIIAHLKHLKENGQTKYYKEAINFLKKKKININEKEISKKENFCACPGSMEMSIEVEENQDNSFKIKSELRQWPIQGHLINPSSDYFKNSNLLVSADCCAFSYGDFHRDFIKGRSVVICCPKLDSNTDVYVDKFISLIDDSKVKSIEIVTMEVPCCFGLVKMVEEALKKSKSKKKPKIKHTVISIKGVLVQNSMSLK
jgi:ferredoxin